MPTSSPLTSFPVFDESLSIFAIFLGVAVLVVAIAYLALTHRGRNRQARP